MENGRWISSRNPFPSKREACLAFYDRLLNPSAGDATRFFSLYHSAIFFKEGRRVACRDWNVRVVFLLSLDHPNNRMQMFRSQLLVIRSRDSRINFNREQALATIILISKKKKKKMLKNRSKLFDKNYLLVKKKKSSSPNYKNKNDENYDACLHLWLKLSINRRISFPRSRHLVFATFARHSRDSSKLKRRAGDRGSFPVNGTYPRSAKSSRETARFGMARSRIDETDRQKLAIVPHLALFDRIHRQIIHLYPASRCAHSWLAQEAAPYPAQKLFPSLFQLPLSPPSLSSSVACN